jgi:hypothetical protein
MPRRAPLEARRAPSLGGAGGSTGHSRGSPGDSTAAHRSLLPELPWEAPWEALGSPESAREPWVLLGCHGSPESVLRASRLLLRGVVEEGQEDGA